MSDRVVSDTDIEDRLRRVESILEDFGYLLTVASQSPHRPVHEVVEEMPSLQRQRGGAVLPVVVESDDESTELMVVPYGFDMPSSELDVCQQQYVDLAQRLERQQRVVDGITGGVREIMGRPPLLDQSLIIALPLIRLIAEEVRHSIPAGCTDCKPVINPETASAVLAFADADLGALTASSEFSEWAWSTLAAMVNVGDERARIVHANLRATGLID